MQYIETGMIVVVLAVVAVCSLPVMATIGLFTLACCVLDRVRDKIISVT